MTLLRFRHDDVLRVHETEPAVGINLSERHYVLLRQVGMADLREAFGRFQARLRDELVRLMCMPTGEVIARYGQLNLRADEERPDDREYGLVTYGDAPAKTVMLKEGALTRALIAAGLAPTGTRLKPDAKKATIKGIGSIGSYAGGLPSRDRARLIRATFDEMDLDAALKVAPPNAVGMAGVAEALARSKDPSRFLEDLAANTERFFRDERPKAGTGLRSRIFAPAWFAQHLAAEGVWLQPIGNISNLSYLYPTLLLPVAVRMAVPARREGLAEAVLSARRVGRGTSLEGIARSFLAIAGSSDLWHGDTVAASPLVAFKEQAQLDEKRSMYSHVANALYDLTCQHYGVPLQDHWMASLLITSKRVAGRGVDPFHWTEHPNRRNTAKIAEILGRPVDEVPDWIAQWARDLRDLLPLFKRKNIDRLTSELAPWLVYLLTLDPATAPRDFSQVERRHVNSFGRKPDFITFLDTHYANANASIAAAAPSAMKNAWVLSAMRNDFAERKTLPFDTEMDRVVPEGRGRLARTSRSAMDQKVLAILIDENRKDDFGYARDLVVGNGQAPWWRVVVDAETGRHERVFFPLAPLVVDIIMHSGLRLTQTTWLDSGEGDECLVDAVTGSERPNTWASAMPGRRAGFLRTFELMDGGTQRRVLGMHVNTDKSGKSYEVPWIEPEVARSVTRLRDLQQRFNRLERPVAALRADPDNRFVSVAVPDAFPLFRDPKHKLPEPVTDAQVRGYWLGLLVHAQARVDRELGFTYPLVVNGQPRFDVHSLRVTTVTVLLENGVPVEIVQSLVGHASVLMTWYYNAVENSQIHREIQLGMERRKSVDGRIGVDDPNGLARRVAEADPVTLREPDDYAAVDLVRDHLDRTTGVDVFVHGICPGGDCRTGGERIAAGRYGPVWRQRACSRCRYRLTGVPFLAGLVHRLNGLMAEIKASVHREQQINDEVVEVEDAGGATTALRRNAARERSDRDALFSEWCAELRTVKEAERRLHAAAGNGRELVPLEGFDLAKLSLGTRESHDFELLHTVVSEAGIMPGATLDLPAGVQERRDGWLREIIRAERLEDVVYSPDERTARRAMNALGDMLLARAGTGERLQALLDGSERLSDDPDAPELRDALVHAALPRRTLIDG